jgi:hypothetical protein
MTGIELYMTARRFNSIHEALKWFEQSFSPREVKATVDWAGRYIDSILKEPPAEPIERLGWKVMEFAKTFDHLFGRYVKPPKTGCKRGEVRINDHACSMREALADFHERFGLLDHPCKVGALIRSLLSSNLLDRLAAAELQAPRGSAQKAIVRLRNALAGHQNRQAPVTCKECAKLGDLLIAAEQPPTWLLYHLDASFDLLCPLFGAQHKCISSIRQVAKDVDRG